MKNYKVSSSKFFSDELINLLENKKQENTAATALKKLVDGENKNVDPLTEIPESQMKLYGIEGIFKSAYFDTEKELIDYVKEHNTQFSNICVIDYLGDVADCIDVVRLTYKNGKQVLYTAVDEDGYGIYNHERSVYRGEFVWEYYHGDIRSMYSAFRDRGIIFKNDIYKKIDDRNKKIMEMFEEQRRGPILTRKK